MTTILTRNVSEPLDHSGGFRVLVERDWPDDVQNVYIHADIWLKDVTPSAALNDWFAHDPLKWGEFKSRFFAELDHQQEAISKLLAETEKGPITLLNTASDSEFNPAVALREYLISRGSESASQPALGRVEGES